MSKRRNGDMLVLDLAIDIAMLKRFAEIPVSF